jgi:hypothetical protein
VLVAVNGERSQSAQRVAQAQAGHPGHGVQLGGPRVAERDRAQLGVAVAQQDVVRDEALRHDVVLVDADVVPGDAEGAEALAVRQALEVGHPDLDQDVPARAQVRGGVGEARDLRVLRREVADGVEDQKTSA